MPEFGETEVLWALHPDAWGQGYATEMARAALDYGFETLGLELIFAITCPTTSLAGGDEAARPRLSQRVDYKGFMDIVWFDIERATWPAR